jgi:hypothetical protein
LANILLLSLRILPASAHASRYWEIDRGMERKGKLDIENELRNLNIEDFYNK